MTSPEQELLESLSAAITQPGDGAVATRLLAAQRALPSRHVLSDEAREKVRTLAGLRAQLHRDFLFFLVGALRGDADPAAIAFMIAIVLDPGVGSGAIDALDTLDPRIVAGPYRAAAIANSAGAAEVLLRAGLEAKIALTLGEPVELTPELLELWVSRCDASALRLAIAAGADVKAKISFGETLLTRAVAEWTAVTWDDPFLGPTRPMWEEVIAMLIAAGADADRKLEMRFQPSDYGWAKGTTPRKMIAETRKMGNAPPADLDRLEALLPAAAKKGGKKAP